MANQSSVYNEKKIAYYESTFRTSMLSKPLEVNITVTAAHLYGLAYIMEQNGTKEGDPVYMRFTCSLDEITKVYINDNVKTSPLYVQCDNMNKGVLNRKRIIVPCLQNVAEAVETINSAKAAYDEKMQKSKERMNAQKAVSDAANTDAAEDKMKEYERMKKLADAEFDNLPPLKAKASVQEAPAAKPEAPAAPSAPAEAQEKPVHKTVKPKVTIEDLIKINNSIEIDIIPPAEPPITGKKPAAGILEELGADTAPAEKNLPKDSDLAAEGSASDIKLEEMTVENSHKTEDPDLSDLSGIDEKSLLSDLSDIPEVKAVENIINSAAKPAEAAEEVNEEPAVAEAAEDAYATTAVADSEVIAADDEIAETEPESDTKPEIKEVHVDFSSDDKKDMSLDDFQTAVKKLKAMHDEGLISDDEFKAEKKKLLAQLY